MPQLFTLTESHSPVVLHAPHGSRYIPDQLRDTFTVTDAELNRELDLMTDHHTDELVQRISGASSVVNQLSRFVVDVERFPDEREEMLAVGMGAFYTHGTAGQAIRSASATTDPWLRAHFDAYSAAFTELVQGTVDRHGHAVIIDVHSYPSSPLPYELHAGEPRPQLDIGSDSRHTPPQLIDQVCAAFAGFETGVNESFHGSYVPLRFYEANDMRVTSVMLEIRRDGYLNEATLQRNEVGFDRLAHSLQRLVDSIGTRP